MTERMPTTDPLTAADREAMLAIASDTIGRALVTGVRRLPDVDDLTARLRQPGATFVTLRRDGMLLGCIGALEPYQPVGIDVAEHALAAAFDDPRVPPIEAEDFFAMTIEVSVLGALHEVDVVDHQQLAESLRVGKDGLLVVAPGHRATFLPSVWESVGDVDEFLAMLWRKAGLWPREWPKGIRVFLYEVDEFAAEGPRGLPTA
jgi:AmmeMemoRadiSam system protein A